MAQNFEIEAPTPGSRGPQYDQACREALKPAFENLLDVAAEVGWDRKRAAYELMYLASNSIAAQREYPERTD